MKQGIANKYLYTKCILTTFVLLFLSFSLNAQKTATVRGHIDCEDKDIFYDVVVLSSDSSIIKGQSFTTDSFKIELPYSQKYLLKISSVQFNPKYIPVDATDGSVDLGNIEISINEFDDVVVVGRKPTITHELNKIAVNVENSYLQDVGTLSDLLAKTPGLIKNREGNIGLIEGGNVTFFVNNRKVLNKDELQSIQSSDIKSIVVDMSPSAKYNASTVGGVFITTKKKQDNHFYIAPSNEISFGRKIIDYSNIVISHKNSNISNYLSLGYDISSLMQYDHTTETVFNTLDTLYSKKDRNSNYKNNILNAFYLFDWSINTAHSLGLQYTGRIIDGTTLAPTHQVINAEPSDYTQDKNNDSYLHNMSLNYHWQIDTAKELDIITDYAFSKDKTAEDINTQPTTHTNSSNRFKVWGNQIDFSLKKQFANINIGTSTAMISDNGEYAYNSLFNNYTVKDNTYSIYVSGDKRIKDFYIRLGLRGELTENKVGISKESILDTLYFKLFPSLVISKKFPSNVSVGFTVGQSIARPSFGQINPNLKYYDKISYSVGNPSLKPQIIIRKTKSTKMQNEKYKKNGTLTSVVFFMPPVAVLPAAQAAHN